MKLFFSALKNQPLSMLSVLLLALLPVLSYMGGKGDPFTEFVLAFSAVSASIGLIIQREFDNLYKSVTGMTPSQVALEALKVARNEMEVASEE